MVSHLKLDKQNNLSFSGMSIFTCGTQVLKQGWLHLHPTPKNHLEIFRQACFTRKQTLNLRVFFFLKTFIWTFVLKCAIFSRQNYACIFLDTQVYYFDFSDTFLVRFTNGLIMWLGRPFEYQTFYIIKEIFFFRFSDHHLKIGPFNNQTFLDHLNTRLVRYSDGYCTWASPVSPLRCSFYKFFYFHKEYQDAKSVKSI